MARRQNNRRFRFKYAVLGEGITEQYYLTYLKKFKGYRYSVRPILFQDIGIEKAEAIIDELVSGECDQITYFTDYDTIANQGKRAAFDKLVKKYEDNQEVLICESMPSIEYWFLLHFRYTTMEFSDCKEVLVELKKHINDYSKSGQYLKTERWFNKLLENDGLGKATTNAEKGLKVYENDLVSTHFPFTKIPRAIEEFDKQINNR
ncbi:MAG: RloB domain-containing protein [Deltaproteobacteria bacterium]|nr:RloB domain-containing protein [Deltaproteobacteria bacterium]